MGHDVVLVADTWIATVSYDAATPSRSAVEATVDPASLRVLSGQGGVLPLTPFDKREIRRAMRRDVLDVAHHPEVSFVSTGASGYRVRGDTAELRLSGDLTLTGVTRKVSLQLKGIPSSREIAVTGEARIVPSRFGIRQYTAFLGALKVKDEVVVRLNLRLPTTGRIRRSGAGTRAAERSARRR